MKFYFICALLLICSGPACRVGDVQEFQNRLAGAYDVDSRYEFDEGFFGELSPDWLDPAHAVETNLRSTIDSRYGRSVTEAYDALARSSVQRLISSHITGEAPIWLTDIQPSLEVVDRKLAVVDVDSAMLVTEDGEDGFRVRQMWQGISTFDDPECPTSGAILCPQTRFSIDTLLDSEYPLDIVTSDQRLTIEGERADLAGHNVSLNYGRLGLYMLVNQVLPDTPSKNLGLRDVVLAAVNCRGLASRVTGGQESWTLDVGGVAIGIDLEEIIGSCQEGVLAEVNRVVDRFSVPMEMELSGSALLVDTSRDGSIDQFTRGNLGGTRQLEVPAGIVQDSFSGRFVGFRVDESPTIEPVEAETVDE